MNPKADAHEFLVGLETELRVQLPSPERMRDLMVTLATDSPSIIRENIFLYHCLKIVSAHMQTINGIGLEEARLSLLCEYHKKVPDVASANSFRRPGHPFSKDRRIDDKKILQSWIKPEGTFPINQAYPDFGFRSPFPYKIVFDAKYFCNDGQGAADKALVDGAYEVMFYRGLPRAENWDYDYACLLAYDASDHGLLKKVWNQVNCKSTFWDGGNIFIMII